TRRGPLRITVETYTCYHWLPELVRAYRLQHADIDVRIEPAGSAEPIRSLLDGSVDIAIIARVREHRLLVARPRLHDRSLLVLPRWTVDRVIRGGIVSARPIEGLPVWRWTVAVVREAAERGYVRDFAELLVRRSRRWQARSRDSSVVREAMDATS